jgi:uncharacterized protein YjdB
MKVIQGEIITLHRNASCVAGAIRPDNLLSMQTLASGDVVRTVVSGTKLRSLIASVDDYLMNLAIAEELCGYTSR